MLQSSLVPWSSFQMRLVAYFQLEAAIDSFFVDEQMYIRQQQQQLHTTAIHYYHDVKRICFKVDLLMNDVPRLRHFYRVFRPESKVLDRQRFYGRPFSPMITRSVHTTGEEFDQGITC